MKRYLPTLAVPLKSSTELPRRVLLTIALAPMAVVSVVFWQVYRTDPYYRQNNIPSPFTTVLDANSNQIKLTVLFEPQLKNNFLANSFALLKTGIRIPLYSLTTHEEPLKGSETEIIQQIHSIRFDPSKPYVITGSHYSDLYMRNMGVFFNALLDPRLPTSETDWENRQKIALQTVAYDLAFLKQNSGKAVTTIVPLSGGHFTGLNIYREPSDSVFAVLYSLKALSDPEFVTKRFPAATTPKGRQLQTVTAAQQLLKDHEATLTHAVNEYVATVLDPHTHLVRRDIHISSARDGIKRESSFYDNVIAWSTIQKAEELGIPHPTTLDLTSWKQLIIDTYWDEEKGVFKNDLSTDETIFSADSLIVTSAGFFDLKNETDRHKLDRIISHIRQHKLDEPFPLRYSATNKTNSMHPTVKYFAPSYMGDGIWSHWGMEYIKALVMMAEPSNDYTQLAQKHLESYKHNIEKFGGYPELYDTNGEMFNSTWVRGVLHTGWVVNYEQAKMMVL